MKKYLEKGCVIAVMAAMVCAMTGCAGTGKAMTESASAKNLDLNGYVMYGVVETNNPETATPQGKLIIGRLTYKSRKVGIPADQKVPNTGNFKATKTKTLFGTEELIIEYDWTAGSDAENKAAEARLKKMKEQAESISDQQGDEVRNRVSGATGIAAGSDGAGAATTGSLSE